MANERIKRNNRGGQVRGERHTEPIYTALYKVNRSDELLEFLLRKCNTSRNNVKTLLTNRQVLVNGSVVTQYNFPLAKDDEVKLSKKPVQGNTAPSPIKNRQKETRREVQPIKIITKTKSLLPSINLLACFRWKAIRKRNVRLRTCLNI